jgi:hypothetical protein
MSDVLGVPGAMAVEHEVGAERHRLHVGTTSTSSRTTTDLARNLPETLLSPVRDL